MSDMMGQKPTDAITKNMSMFNPVDIAAMKTPGNPGFLDPNKTTVKQFFAQHGVNVDGPLSQLMKFAQNQMGNADPITKMQNISGGSPEAMGGPQGQPPMAPPEGGDLESLVSQLGS